MLWLILATVFIVLIVWALLSGGDTALDQLPGPPRIPIIGNVHLFVGKNTRELFQTIRNLSKLYGDRYVIKGMNQRSLNLTNPKDIEVVLSHPKNISKSMPYSLMQPWLGTGLLLSTGTKWHKRRKILTPTFHFNILKNFATIIEEKSRDMVTRLKSREVELEVFPVVSDFTLYTICETAMGTQLDQDRSAATQEYKTAVLEMGHLIFSRLTRVWLYNDFIFSLAPIGRKFYEFVNTIHSFADKVIIERKKLATRNDREDVAVEGEVIGKKKRLALLDLLLEAESKGEIDLEGIREEVTTFMFAGHDTTATALTFCLMLLADHEEVQEKIYEECQSIFGDSTRVPSMSDLTEMKYLEAVIKETLRLYPSVPFIARTMSEDFMLGDLLVKKGVEVAVHIYDLHRREDLYPDATAFKPERFLGDTPRHPYAFIPFSAGPRNCIGQRFAMQEMKCVLAEICRNFKLQPRTKGWRPDFQVDMVLRSTDPIYVKFIPR